jgi:hypothetical protein
MKKAGRPARAEAAAAPVPEPCPAEDCVAQPPAGWTGPVVYWGDTAGQTLPDCPESYAQATDVHNGLKAPAGSCSCSCVAEKQVCGSTLRVYGDSNCQGECGSSSSPECTALPAKCDGSQGSIEAERPTLLGGSCVPHVTPIPKATWQNDVRLCRRTDARKCETLGQVCAPIPTPPYSSLLCLMRVIPQGQAVPECPLDYPVPYDPMYTGDADGADDRACSACTCGALSGGSCSGKLWVSSGNTCSDEEEYTLGSGCQTFQVGGRVSHISAEYVLTPGNCSVVTASRPTGSAAPSGPITAVCCQGS